MDINEINRQLDLDLEPVIDYSQHNLEFDLLNSGKIIEKCLDLLYAQHLYAALCNNDFQKNDVYPILVDKRWGCSWRHSGSIVAKLRKEGDYMDWYCSGIKNDGFYVLTSEDFENLTEDQKINYLRTKKYVEEGTVTDEIRKDLFEIGWLVV